MKSRFGSPSVLIPFMIGLFAFIAAPIASTRLARALAATPDNDRLFELRIYHAVPGKFSAMEVRFRDKTSRILAPHNLKVVGYWVTEDANDSSFVFLLAHQSREDANKNWDAFRLDPKFQEVVQAERADKTLEKTEIIWLRPTDFSPMK